MRLVINLLCRYDECQTSSKNNFHVKKTKIKVIVIMTFHSEQTIVFTLFEDQTKLKQSFKWLWNYYASFCINFWIKDIDLGKKREFEQIIWTNVHLKKLNFSKWSKTRNTSFCVDFRVKEIDEEKQKIQIMKRYHDIEWRIVKKRSLLFLRKRNRNRRIMNMSINCIVEAQALFICELKSFRPQLNVKFESMKMLFSVIILDLLTSHFDH